MTKPERPILTRRYEGEKAGRKGGRNEEKGCQEAVKKSSVILSEAKNLLLSF
jgi:hypothetical protein